MKVAFLIAFTSLTLQLNAQLDSIPGLNLYNAKVVSVESDTTNILGITADATKYRVKSKTIVTVLTGDPAKQRVARVQGAVYVVSDPSCIYLEAIYKQLEKYWKEKEDWAIKHRLLAGEIPDLANYIVLEGDTIFLSNPITAMGDFRTIPVEQTFLRKSGHYIASLELHDANRSTFFIFWHDRRLYKMSVIKESLPGGVSFATQNLKLRIDDGDYTLRFDEVRQLEVMQELLKPENRLSCD